MSEKFGREYMGTVSVNSGVIAIADSGRRDFAGHNAGVMALSSLDGYAESKGAVAFQTAWKDGNYDVFCERDEENRITRVEMVLKDD